MSENPYIEGEVYLEARPIQGSRTSVLGVSSLATSLMCCVPMLGVISIVLGASSLLLIGRSNGRLTGRGAAIAGLIVGIMTTVIWGAVGAGTLQGWTFYQKQMIPVGETAMLAVNQNDIAAMRGLLNATADSDLTDEQILVFMDVCEQEMGTINGAARDPGAILSSFIETVRRSQGNNSGGGGSFDEPITPAPMGIEASGGNFFVWFLFDKTTLSGQSDPKLVDIMVMQDGRYGFTLRDDGPGRDMGNMMSLQTSTAREALEAMREERLKQSESAEPGEAAIESDS